MSFTDRLKKSTSVSVFLNRRMFPGGALNLLTILTEYGISKYDILRGHKIKQALYFKFQFSRITWKQRKKLDKFLAHFQLLTFTLAITEADLNLVPLLFNGYHNRHQTFSGPLVFVALQREKTNFRQVMQQTVKFQLITRRL